MTDLLLWLALSLGCAGIGLAVGIPLGRRWSTPADPAASALIVEPVAAALRRVEGLVHATETDRAESHGELRAQVAAMHQTQHQLGQQTAALVTALRAPHVRGRWGEVQLRRIVEAAGLLRHCDFDEQATSATSDGVLRPDLVVRLTDGRSLVVDAKVPFTGFIDAVEAPDEPTRRERMRNHARQVRAHVDTLSGKGYAERFAPSPQFVVMFLPSDGFLQAALEVDPALLEYGFERDVVVATPSTLLALLRTVAYTWRQDAVAAEAQQVLEVGRDLHRRVTTLSGHLGRLSSALTSTVARFNETVGSYEHSVAAGARRLGELGVTGDDLAEVSPVERLVREPRVERPHRLEPPARAG